MGRLMRGVGKRDRALAASDLSGRMGRCANGDPFAPPAAANSTIVELFPSLDRALIKSLFDGQPTETFSVGRPIFCEGDKATSIFWVMSGQLQLYKMLADGRRAVTDFIFPDEFVGVSFHSRFLVSAEAVCDLKLRRLSRRRFQDMANASPFLQSQVSVLSSRDLRSVQDHILLLARMSAEERLATFLLDVYCRSGSSDEIVLPMSRADVADYLGLTVETVSRMISALARRGLISTRRFGHVVKIIDVRGLSQIAPIDPRHSIGSF